MPDLVRIPVFPLSIFPLPGELVPLHVFEPRYRQLLQEAESRDISFGIYFNHTSNDEKLGSLVKLESVIKRYPSGESDVIVKCADLFSMTTLYHTFKDKLYPGGDVTFWNLDPKLPISEKLEATFLEYLQLLKINRPVKTHSIFEVANELNLSFAERLKFVRLDSEKQETFLQARLRYQSALLQRAEKVKDVFHLN